MPGGEEDHVLRRAAADTNLSDPLADLVRKRILEVELLPVPRRCFVPLLGPVGEGSIPERRRATNPTVLLDSELCVANPEITPDGCAEIFDISSERSAIAERSFPEEREIGKPSTARFGCH